METEFRRLPSVDSVLADERLKQLGEVYPHILLVNLVRQQLERERLAIAAGNPVSSFTEIVDSICAQVQALEKSQPAPGN